MNEELAVQVDGLRKVYGGTVAVDGVSFEVHRGEIFGMVGPNGAGKTTTIECIEGLRRHDGGQVRVLGLDPRVHARELRPRMGVQLQQSALQDRIRVWEALDLYARLYPRAGDWEPLLGQLGLEDSRDKPFAKLSGGQKQRLFIALALVNDPELLFLDELTTGLDPQSRRAMWELVRGIREHGKTVVITTHFMEEAERLCDRVAILDHGRIVALDSPTNLIGGLGAQNRVTFMPDGVFDPRVLRRLPSVNQVEVVGEHVMAQGSGDYFVADVVNALAREGVRFRDLRTEQPSLEDVFLALTGREIRD